MTLRERLRALRAGRAAAGEDTHRAAVGGHWDEVGRLQFDFLRDRGLRTDQTLVDVPCGSFRAGRFLLEYLEPGNYVGIDADEELIEAGRREVLGPLADERRARILCAAMPAELPAADVVWIHALFDHVPPEATRATLAEAARAAPRVFATFFLVDDASKPVEWERRGGGTGIVTYPDREYWHHSREFVAEAAREAGLRVVAEHESYARRHPLGLTVVELERA